MTTQKVELTKLKLDHLTPARNGERYEVADTHVAGLRVRVGDREIESGKFKGKAAQISFILLARFPSKPKPNPTRRTLGNYSREYSSMSLAEAREKAIIWKSLIALGKDPAVEEKKRRANEEELRTTEAAALRLRKTVGQALDTYSACRLAQLRRGAGTLRALAGRQGLLSEMLNQEIGSIRRSEISNLVRKRAEVAPISANRQLAYAHAFFNWCVDEEIITVNPAAKIRKPAKESARSRYHSLDELVEIWQAAGRLGYPFGHLYRLLMVLPMRREELAGLEISELQRSGLDDCYDVWLLPAARTKRSNALRVPLSSVASQIIAEVIADPARPPNSRYLFTTTGETPVSGFARAKRRLDKAITDSRLHADEGSDVKPAPMPHWTIHDLRTSFNTHACELLNVDISVADRILNHMATATTSKIMRVYNRSELFDQRRSALQAWADLILYSLNKQDNDKVVSLASHRK